MNITSEKLFSRIEISVSDHCCEPVEEINGVVYINDSKATDIHKTLQTLNQLNSPTVLITGGSDEGTDYSYLSEISTDVLKKIIYTGRDAAKIKRQFIQHAKIEFVHLEKDLKKCIEHCIEKCDHGFVVLYSPACPSFDVFDNYKNRGNQFKSIVKKLKSE